MVQATEYTSWPEESLGDVIGKSEDILKLYGHSYLRSAPGGARIPDARGFRNGSTGS